MPRGTLTAPGEKLRMAFTPAATTASTDELRRRRRHGDHHDANPLALDDLPKIARVGDQNPAARAPADLLLERVEQRDHLEPVLAEAGVIGKREAEVAGAHDRHTDVAIETEDLLQVPPQLLDVVPDAAYAELAEVRQVLPNLRRIQLELLGKRLRRNRADAHRIEGRQRSADTPTGDWWSAPTRARPAPGTPARRTACSLLSQAKSIIAPRVEGEAGRTFAIGSGIRTRTPNPEPAFE